MQTKGISIFELHIEKFILLLAVLLLIGVAVMQFLGSPNQVEIPQHGEVNPGEVDQILEEEAEKIEIALRDDAAPVVTFGEANAPLHFEQFQSRLINSVTPEQMLAQVKRDPGQILADSAAAITGLYHVPEPPQPQIVSTVSQTSDALLEEEVQRYPERFKNLFPNPDEPKDITFTTVAANFDLRKMREELRYSDSQSAGIPPKWYGGTDRVLIPDVVLEREEYVDGQWTNTTIIKPLPGQLSYRSEIQGEPDAGFRSQLMTELSIRENQMEILQPGFLATKNAAFNPPRDGAQEQVETSEVESEDIIQLRRRIQNLEEDIARFQKRLDELGGPVDRNNLRGPGGDRDDEDDDEKSGGGGFGGGMGGSGSGKRDDQGMSEKGDPAVRFRLQKRIERHQQRIERARQQLGDKVPAEEEAPEEEPINLATDEQVLIWAHDITAQPGHRYRYRMRVRVFNPFFAHKIQLDKKQRDLAEKPVLASASSDWTDRVKVAPHRRVFVVDASPDGGQLGLGEATVEIYRLYDGQWQMEKFRVQPGDRVGAIAAPESSIDEQMPPIDFGTDWYVVDIMPSLGENDARAYRSGERAATVIVDSIGKAGLRQIRHTNVDRNDPARTKLKNKFELSQL